VTFFFWFEKFNDFKCNFKAFSCRIKKLIHSKKYLKFEAHAYDLQVHFLSRC
jgi:hypothetical protein